MPATDVVTVFLIHDGRILVLRRSDAVATYSFTYRAPRYA